MPAALHCRAPLMGRNQGSGSKRGRDEKDWKEMYKDRVWGNECLKVWEAIPEGVRERFEGLIVRIVGDLEGDRAGKGRKKAKIEEKAQDKVDVSQSDVLITLEGANVVTPRGKWKISLTMDYRMIMELKGKQLVIKKKNIRRILQLPHINARDRILALEISEPVQVGKSKYRIIVLKFGGKASPIAKWHNLKDINPQALEFKGRPDDDVLANYWDGITPIKPRKDFFASADSKSAITCTVKANTGALYPLKEGLFYLGKPLVFLARQDFEEIRANRGGSAIGAYFDLSVECEGKVYEFGMISKRQNGSIQGYVSKISQLRLKEEASQQKKKTKSVVDSDEDDDEDSDFAPEGEERYVPDDYTSDEEKLQDMDQEYKSEGEDEEKDESGKGREEKAGSDTDSV